VYGAILDEQIKAASPRGSGVGAGGERSGGRRKSVGEGEAGGGDRLSARDRADSVLQRAEARHVSVCVGRGGEPSAHASVRLQLRVACASECVRACVSV